MTHAAVARALAQNSSANGPGTLRDARFSLTVQQAQRIEMQNHPTVLALDNLVQQIVATPKLYAGVSDQFTVSYGCGKDEGSSIYDGAVLVFHRTEANLTMTADTSWLHVLMSDLRQSKFDRPKSLRTLLTNPAEEFSNIRSYFHKP